MDIKINIRKLTKKALKKIKEAAENKDLKRIQQYSFFLSQIDYITLNLKELESKLERLEKDFEIAEKVIEEIFDNTPPESSELLNNQLSAKAKAKIKRNEFIDLLRSKEINLDSFKGVVYKDQIDHGLIGIAYSCDNGDSWFLGLPDYNYKIVVLLCDDEKGKINAIILPKEFFDQHKENLSKSHNQIKFNVKKAAGNYNLYIKGGSVTVNKYLNKYEIFLQRH